MAANMCSWYFLSTFPYNDKTNALVKVNNKDATDTAIIFLGNSIDKAPTPEEIARKVNLSASQFSGVFKKEKTFIRH